ncbi:MAG: FKBP-type peptidyl-prolyl cis-trans isomerase [Chlamydia sp.]
MMDRKRFLGRISLPIAIALFSLSFGVQGFAEEKPQQETIKASPGQKRTKEELATEQNIFKISQSYGYMIAKSVDNSLIKLNLDAVIQGIKDQQSGKNSLMTEQEYEEFLTELQEVSFQEDAKKNQEEAEKFLQENSAKKGVQIFENGKLQVLVETPGSGNDIVTDGVMPVIHYTGSYLNGTVFGSSKEPFPISLDQTLPGFKTGVLGMKIGEKRRIFIHPDLGYGVSGQLMPNALLIFDVELVRLDPIPQVQGDVEGEDDHYDDVTTDDSEDDDLADDDEDSDSELDLVQ